MLIGAHRARRGRWRFRVRAGVTRTASACPDGIGAATTLLPPAPDPGLVVDPRVGARGPALLALEDGTVFRGIAFGARRRGGRRPRREHEPDRLPGGLHGPLVRRPGRRDDLPAHRQLRADPGDDQSERPWLPGLVVATRPRPWSSRRASSRRCCGARRIPAIAGMDTRALARHLRATGCLRGAHHGAGRDGRGRRGRRAARAVARWEDQDFVGPSRRPRRSRWASGRSRARPSSPSSTSASRRASCAACGARRRACGCCPTRPRRATCSRPTSPASSSRPGPGDPARLDGPVALARARHRGRPAAAGDLPGPPARGAGRRRRDAPPSLRAPRRQPPGPGHGERAASR